MGAALHEGVVTFTRVFADRERILLGTVAVGEIAPTMDPRSRFPLCFKIDLPDAASRAWRPARDIDDAHRQAAQRISDWIDAAGLRPNGGN